MFKGKRLLVLSSLLLSLLLLASCSGKTIDSEQLVTITENGAENYGSISVNLNEDYYDELLVEIVDPDKGEDIYTKLLDPSIDEQVSDDLIFLDSIYWEIEGENENLKNGDQVTINFIADERFAEDSRYKLSKDSITYKVETLEEAEEVDPFKDLNVTFTGNDGYGELEYPMEPSLPIYGTFSYDPIENLSNGDKVTVTFDYNQDQALMEGYISSSTTKEYTVSGLKELQAIKADDLLALAQVDYIGAEPFATAKISSNVEGEYRDYIDLNLRRPGDDYGSSEINNLKLGDTIEIYINASDSLQNIGYKIDDPTKVIQLVMDEDTIPVFARDIESVNDDQKTEIINHALDVIKSQFAGKSLYNDDGVKVENYTNHKLDQVDLITPKQTFLENGNIPYDKVNALLLTFSADIKYEDDTTKVNYIAVEVPNFIKNPDGTYTYDLSKFEHVKLSTGVFSSRWSFETYEEIVDGYFSPMAEQYNKTNIPKSVFE